MILIYDLVENSYASRIIVGMTSVDYNMDAAAISVCCAILCDFDCDVWQNPTELSSLSSNHRLITSLKISHAAQSEPKTWSSHHKQKRACCFFQPSSSDG